MKIYATGTSGTIGSNLEGVIPLNVDLIEDDTYSQVKHNETGSIIHLAGIVGVNAINSNISHSEKVNIEGTYQFAEFVKEHTSHRFIFVSSSHVYKSSEKRHTEFDQTEPINIYGIQKLKAEKMLISLFSDQPERLVVARVFSILGPKMKIGTLGWKIENLNNLHKLENVDDERDFLTPNEAANRLRKLAQSRLKYQLYNVCSGVSQTVREAAINLMNSLNIPINYQLFVSGNSKTPKIIGDNERFMAEINLR